MLTSKERIDSCDETKIDSQHDVRVHDRPIPNCGTTSGCNARIGTGMYFAPYRLYHVRGASIHAIFVCSLVCPDPRLNQNCRENDSVCSSQCCPCVSFWCVWIWWVCRIFCENRNDTFGLVFRCCCSSSVHLVHLIGLIRSVAHDAPMPNHDMANRWYHRPLSSDWISVAFVYCVWPKFYHRKTHWGQAYIEHTILSTLAMVYWWPCSFLNYKNRIHYRHFGWNRSFSLVLWTDAMRCYLYLSIYLSICGYSMYSTRTHAVAQCTHYNILYICLISLRFQIILLLFQVEILHSNVFSQFNERLSRFDAIFTRKMHWYFDCMRAPSFCSFALVLLVTKIKSTMLEYKRLDMSNNWHCAYE